MIEQNHQCFLCLGAKNIPRQLQTGVLLYLNICVLICGLFGYSTKHFPFSFKVSRDLHNNHQGFPNSVKEWEKWEILLRGNFLLGGENLRRSIFTIPTFSKVSTTFCKYWTSIKIKVSMTYLYKECEVKIMLQEEWLQLKWSFHWVITWKFLFSGGN